MRSNWTQNAPMPGSVRPVYGAQFPPLQSSGQEEGAPANAPTTTTASSPTKSEVKFKKYENSVSDVWDAGVSLDDSLALSSAAKVLEQDQEKRSAAGAVTRTPSLSVDRNDVIMPNCQPVPSKYNKVQAMQRLAIQKEPIPGIANSSSSSTQSSATTQPAANIYPRLPEVSLSSASTGGKKPLTVNTSGQAAHHHHQQESSGEGDTNQSSRMASIIPKSPKGKNGDMSRFDRLRRMLGVQPSSGGGGMYPTTTDGGVINMDELRKDCWLGIPHKIRPLAWRILSGYVPSNLERKDAVLKRKREEYWHYVEQYFHTRYDEQHQVTFRQIHIDIPRMCPLIPLFQQKMVQEIFERVLYIWAIRHPASGYVQGINDLVTPFFVVFLSEFIQDDVEVGTFDVAHLARSQMEVVEADSFWCVSALLDTIQDNYTFAQPGIQRKVANLKDLISRVDRNLYLHFEVHTVEFLQFAFRWMNNLLMREIPLRATIRLWDTYLSERNGFSQFHTYVCGAFLRLWSRQLQNEKDFQGIMLLLQNLPTQNWNDQQICELTADAYSLMQVFHGSKTYST